MNIGFSFWEGVIAPRIFGTKLARDHLPIMIGDGRSVSEGYGSFQRTALLAHNQTSQGSLQRHYHEGGNPARRQSSKGYHDDDRRLK
jgi:hypothetical protein